MPRKRDGFVPLSDVAGAVELSGDHVLTHRAAAVPARRHFTRLDQVTQLVGASEADADLGFMARLLALCTLPRTNPGNRLRYVRRNGPYTLVMNAGGLYKLPFGNLPRLLLAWVSTEAVRTSPAVDSPACSCWVIHCPSSCGSSTSTARAAGDTRGSAIKWTACLMQAFPSSTKSRTVEKRLSTRTWPTVRSSGGARRDRMTVHCGRARSNWARSFSRK